MTALVAEGVSVRYGSHVAVSAASLAVAPGEVVALIGPNGSGKSSLLRALAGMVRHEGSVRRPSGRIGFMPQEAASSARLGVLETVLLGRLETLGLGVSRNDIAAASALLARLGIGDLAARSLDVLSGGQRQLVFLAQALACDPRVLLLDEPTSALDLRHGLALLSLLRALARAEGLATVLSLHDLNAAARVADRIVVLREGRVHACGTPRAVLTAPLIAEVYGVAAEVTEGADGAPSVLALAAL